MNKGPKKYIKKMKEIIFTKAFLGSVNILTNKS